MVAADGEQAVDGMRAGRRAEQFAGPGLDRCQRFGDRVRVAGNVAGIGELQVGEGLDVELGMVLGSDGTRRLANGHRSEAGAGTEADPSVEGCAEDRDIAPLDVTKLGKPYESRGSGIARHRRGGDGLYRSGLIGHTRRLYGV